MINFKRSYFLASLFILATPAQVNAEHHRNCYGDDPNKYETIVLRSGKLLSTFLPKILFDINTSHKSLKARKGCLFFPLHNML